MTVDTAICVSNLGKRFRIFVRPIDRVWQAIWGSRKQLYREFWALREVSFAVAKGETIAIIGRNGSGKSTLLQLICGTLTPTTGEVEVGGRIGSLLELGAGFNPEFTGRENVYLNGSIMGLSASQIDERLGAIIAFADIGDSIDQPIKAYSAGMTMRLAFAIVANLDADILVIDEVLAVGDVFFVQKCMRFLREFRERGTILFCSHDTASVINLCSRAIWLEEGRIRQLGSAREVTEAYLEAFLESRQGPSQPKPTDGAETLSAFRSEEPVHDQRMEFINRSPYRNDIELFSFRPGQRAFGTGGVEIVDVRMETRAGDQLGWVVGGEVVALSVRARVRQDIANPVIGFVVKDRLGQQLFGDNSSLTYQHHPTVSSGDYLAARFLFQMPILPAGEYAVSVAVAEANQDQVEAVFHQWIHDALVFRSHRSHVTAGLVGIPMMEIELKTETAPEGRGSPVIEE